MYKKSSKYFVGLPNVLKHAAGVAQSDQLLHQRRKVTLERPIVALTKTCAYC